MRNFFKNNLRFLLEERDISFSHFSREAGVSKQAVSEWLSNKEVLPSIIQATKIKHYFGISLDSLFFHDLKGMSLLENKSEIDLFKMSKVALFSWDFNGTIEYVNQCLSDLLFFSQEELVTRSIFELIHTEDLIRFEVEFEKIVNGSTDSSHVNLRYLVGEGRFSWFQHLMIVSREEKKIYAFIFSLPGKLFSHETFLLEKIDLEHVILGELKRRRKDERTEFVFKNNSQSTYIVECSSKVALQSLLRAVVYQYHSLESSHPHCKIEVSLVERDKVISVNFSGDCVLRPKKSFFLGIYKIAKILDIKMEELVVGELYFIRFDLKKS